MLHTNTTTLRGVVRTIVAEKGFAFLRADDGRDYFVHASALVAPLTFADLQQGDTLFFTPTHPDRGPRAEDVTKG
ncbi:MAG TPA: cold shock domain-containing protein [Vicinamibacterales bacterium]